jgi:hypothetical protein
MTNQFDMKEPSLMNGAAAFKSDENLPNCHARLGFDNLLRQKVFQSLLNDWVFDRCLAHS